MLIFIVKEKYIGSAISEIIWHAHRQTNRHAVTFILGLSDLCAPDEGYVNQKWR